MHAFISIIKCVKMRAFYPNFESCSLSLYYKPKVSEVELGRLPKPKTEIFSQPKPKSVLPQPKKTEKNYRNFGLVRYSFAKCVSVNENC